MRLIYVNRLTTNVQDMTRFYRDGLGLGTAAETPGWVEFTTGRSSLGLVGMPAGRGGGQELVFQVDDLERTHAALRGRGMEFVDEMQPQPWGKVVHARDPEGVVVTLIEPAMTPAGRGEPALATVILNTWDFGSGLHFYRDRLGLAVMAESPHWVEFELDGARIVLHARAERPDLPAHAGQKLACVFEVDDLEAWADAIAERETALTTEPTAEAFGVYAEVMDPDGNLVVFREHAAVVPVPDAIAEDFEDEGSPVQAAMRRRSTKKVRALSRVVNRPQYKAGAPKKPASGPGRKALELRPEARSRDGGLEAAAPSRGRKLKVTTTRGAGEERTRSAPKTLRDLKRAKAKPAQGRHDKAVITRGSAKKTAVARASRGRPVKRATAKRAAPRGAAARAAARGRR